MHTISRVLQGRELGRVYICLLYPPYVFMPFYVYTTVFAIDIQVKFLHAIPDAKGHSSKSNKSMQLSRGNSRVIFRLVSLSLFFIDVHMWDNYSFILWYTFSWKDKLPNLPTYTSTEQDDEMQCISRIQCKILWNQRTSAKGTWKTSYSL